MVHFSLTDIGPLPGYHYSQAVALNSHGQCLGYSWGIPGQHPDDWRREAFLWHDGRFTDLGAFSPQGLNDHGQVVGQRLTGRVKKSKEASITACRYAQGLADLSMRADVVLSSARAVNNKGEIAGKLIGQRPARVRACLWAASIGELEPPPGFSACEAHGINDAGQVVGEASQLAGKANRAVASLWDRTQETVLPMPSGFHESRAVAINRRGVIVGSADTDADWDERRQSACFWIQGRVRLLGSLCRNGSSIARAVNDSGQIIGNADVEKGDRMHAFLWQHDSMTDMNGLVPENHGWLLVNASGINDTGQIICTGIRDGKMHALLLSPI